MAKINSEILRWARESAGLSLSDAAKQLGISKVENLQALEDGSKAPSPTTLEKMSKQYRRPLITFYMPAPPRRGDRGSDFRTLPENNRDHEQLIDALIRDLKGRQSSVRELLIEEGIQPHTYVGSATMKMGVSSLAKDICSRINFKRSIFRMQKTKEESFKYLRDSTEAVGVFVILAGDLGSHHTSIPVEAFRGFALADSVAPFIAINNQDAKSAWSFTLLHELAHIWLGESGISGAYSNQTIERFCNDVASEILVPAEELSTLTAIEYEDNLASHINEFASERHVSRALVAYKLFRANHITETQWKTLVQQYKDEWASEKQKLRPASGGPSYYVVKRHRLGQALINLVNRSMAEGELTPVKAGMILGAKPHLVRTLTQYDNAIGRAS